MTDVVFSPTPAQRALKAVFLVAVKNLPPEPSYSLARIEQLCPGIEVERHWSTPGFREWFTNTTEFQEMAELASFIALQTCIEVMTNQDEKGQARVTAAKLAVEVADKLPKGKPVSALPEKIQKMDDEQLKAFIAQAAPLLTSV